MPVRENDGGELTFWTELLCLHRCLLFVSMTLCLNSRFLFEGLYFLVSLFLLSADRKFCLFSPKSFGLSVCLCLSVCLLVYLSVFFVNLLFCLRFNVPSLIMNGGGF